MISEKELDAIEDRLLSASPGPWTAGFNGSLRSAWAIQVAGSTRVVVNLDSEKNIALDEVSHQVENDIDFIGHSRDDMETLLRAIRKGGRSFESKSEIERLRKILEFYASPGNYRPPPAGTPGVWVGNDLGKMAREALAAEGEK